MKKTAKHIADEVIWKCAQDPVSESEPYAGQNVPDPAPPKPPKAGRWLDAAGPHSSYRDSPMYVQLRRQHSEEAKQLAGRSQDYYDTSGREIDADDDPYSGRIIPSFREKFRAGRKHKR